VAWNLWVFAISILAGIGLVVTTNISYALHIPWMKDHRGVITLVSCLLVIAMMAAAVRGLGLGKWVHNAGGIMLLVTFVALIGLPLFGVVNGTVRDYHPFLIGMPEVTGAQGLLNVNVYSKLALGALTGFEYIAIMAGETRAPARNIGRSVIIAAPIIAVMFILGTSSVLAFVSPDKVDLIGPIPQVLSIGFGSYGWVGNIVSIAILGVVVRQIALMSIYFAGNTRLPMVAGWDQLLPKWFTRLHARYKTPVNSILFVGLVTLVLGLASLIDTGTQEAFQALDNAGGVFYALTYMVLFAIPLFGMKSFSVRAPWWLKLTSASGLLVSLLYICFTPIPIIEVPSRLRFALKIIVPVLIANAIGALLYWLGSRRKLDVGQEATSVPP
jgi:amino acid transporter